MRLWLESTLASAYAGTKVRSKRFCAAKPWLIVITEHTQLFEQMINTAISMRPGIKIMFSGGPSDIINVINRNFPENF
jgi:hypothetical protein